MSETLTETKKVCNPLGKCERCKGIGICYFTLGAILIVLFGILYLIL
ncbi:hypothetical protein KKA03_01800 [archaeon]|nr:hypothetical protein [archaeon]